MRLSQGILTTFRVKPYGVEYRHALPNNNFGYGTTLYGHAKKQELFGNERVEAERDGHLPYSFQVIKWFTLAWFPIIPLGTYRVIKEKQGFWAIELPEYKMFAVDWDWAQVLRHYLIVYGWIIVAFLMGFLAERLKLRLADHVPLDQPAVRSNRSLKGEAVRILAFIVWVAREETTPLVQADAALLAAGRVYSLDGGVRIARKSEQASQVHREGPRI